MAFLLLGRINKLDLRGCLSRPKISQHETSELNYSHHRLAFFISLPFPDEIAPHLIKRGKAFKFKCKSNNLGENKLIKSDCR